MTWHAVLVTAEQAAIWTTVAGVVATLLAWVHRGPLRRIADRLDTQTPGGLTDVVQAIRDAAPPPDQPTTSRKRHA